MHLKCESYNNKFYALQWWRNRHTSWRNAAMRVSFCRSRSISATTRNRRASSSSTIYFWIWNRWRISAARSWRSKTRRKISVKSSLRRAGWVSVGDDAFIVCVMPMVWHVLRSSELESTRCLPWLCIVLRRVYMKFTIFMHPWQQTRVFQFTSSLEQHIISGMIKTEVMKTVMKCIYDKLVYYNSFLHHLIPPFGKHNFELKYYKLAQGMQWLLPLSPLPPPTLVIWWCYTDPLTLTMPPIQGLVNSVADILFSSPCFHLHRWSCHQDLSQQLHCRTHRSSHQPQKTKVICQWATSQPANQ